MTETAIPVFCADCGATGAVGQVTASLVCRSCGSGNLGLVGVDPRPSQVLAQRKQAFTDDHVENYRRWAQQEGREPEHVNTLKAYEKTPGVGRAHADFLADQLYVGGGESNWRQEGHRDASVHIAVDHTSDPDFQRAVEVARGHATHEEMAIHHVPEWGENGGHYTPGYRVYKSAPQAPGGLLPPSTPPGTPVAYVGTDGQVRMASQHVAYPKGPGTGWTGPDPRRFDGLNEYVGPTPQVVPRAAPVSDTIVCPVCHGSKYDLIDKGPCRECGGSGVITHPTQRGPAQNYDPGRPTPAGSASLAATGGLTAEAMAKMAGRTSTDPHGSVEQHIRSTTPHYPGNDPERFTEQSPHVRNWSPASAPEGPYQMDQANCPNCGHAPTELRKDKNEDAWWHCPNCGPLANVDKHPEINPYSPPEQFQPDRTMKTGGFLSRNRKTGRLMRILAGIVEHNEALTASEALDIARTTVRLYPEGR